MSIIQAIILGAVQGLTEFIPVSSTGHLVIAHNLMGMQKNQSFDATLHLGTLLALGLYFLFDWLKIFASFFAHTFKGRPYEKDADPGSSGRLLIPILIACIPAAIVGKKWGDGIEEKLTNWQVIAAALVVFGVLLLVAEIMGRKQRDISKMGYSDYLAIGCAQVLALIPGVSRSGITITAGLFRGLNREAAARFSFLLSMPVVFGAGVFSLKHLDLAQVGARAFAAGMISSAVFGLITIHFLLAFLKRKPVTAFVVYRVLLALALVGIFAHK